MSLPTDDTRSHDGSPEHVMNRIAEQIRANGNDQGHGNGNGSGKRIFASPLARRLARDQGIDLASVSGSGPHGRIVKADIEAALAGGAPAAAPAPMQAPAPTPVAPTGPSCAAT